MNIPPKYEDLVAKLGAALGREADLRELLEEMLAAMKETHSLPAKYYGSTLGDRVRALLDACTSCYGSGDLIDAIGDWRGYCSCPAGVELKNRPAAQHQGDPMVFVDASELRNLKVSGFESFSALLYREQASMLCPQRVALYAEQPAPVAVDPEMLERLPEINFSNYGQDEVEALQAWAFEAYEAIARLNGVKP